MFGEKKKLKPYKTNKITIFNSLINFITYKNLPIRFIKQLINTNNIQNDIYTKLIKCLCLQITRFGLQSQYESVLLMTKKNQKLIKGTIVDLYIPTRTIV